MATNTALATSTPDENGNATIVTTLGAGIIPNAAGSYSIRRKAPRGDTLISPRPPSPSPSLHPASPSPGSSMAAFRHSCINTAHRDAHRLRWPHHQQRAIHEWYHGAADAHRRAVYLPPGAAWPVAPIPSPRWPMHPRSGGGGLAAIVPSPSARPASPPRPFATGCSIRADRQWLATAISADGRYVAFISDNPDLVVGDTSGVAEVLSRRYRAANDGNGNSTID